jgi:hypothetical protein
MHFTVVELLHKTCFSENYRSETSASAIDSGHPMDTPQPHAHHAVQQTFHGVPLPLYCPLPAHKLVISHSTTQQPLNTLHPSYRPNFNVPGPLNNAPGYGHHVPGPPNYYPPQQFQFNQSQLPTFPPGEHAQMYFQPQPYLYGGNIQYTEPSSMYGNLQDTRATENRNHNPPPPASAPRSSHSTGITSTPVLYRMSAMRPPGDNSLISAHQLEDCLQKELHGNVVVTSPQFFLDLLWPNNMMPLPINYNIFPTLVKNGVWDSVHDCFVNGPVSYTEVDMARWLNALGGMLGIFTTQYGVERRRVWYPGNCNKSPEGLTINCKPDLTLLDKSDTAGHISWSMIHALGEVTSEAKFPKRMYSTINDKSYLLFLSQHDRRFAPALCFDGMGMFSLTITDRQGQITMPPMSLLRGKGNALILMKILCFLMYGDLHFTGRDPTMILDLKKKVTAIIVNGHTYEVVHIIYTLQSLIGRGTTIWFVFRDGNFFILKDSWIQTSRVGSEISLLEKLKHDEELKDHVPHIVEGEDIKVKGVVDSTGHYREFIGGTEEQRIHRRLVLTPIGLPITGFKSKADFIFAMIDIVAGKLLDQT